MIADTEWQKQMNDNSRLDGSMCHMQKSWPFWHMGMPFLGCGAMPYHGEELGAYCAFLLFHSNVSLAVMGLLCPVGLLPDGVASGLSEQNPATPMAGQ